MVSMLLNGDAKCIHICAPSNSAVDEILVRILQRGLPGIATTHQELLSIITRIGASEYTAPDEIAPFSLKEKIDTKVRNEMLDQVNITIKKLEFILKSLKKSPDAIADDAL